MHTDMLMVFTNVTPSYTTLAVQNAQGSGRLQECFVSAIVCPLLPADLVQSISIGVLPRVRTQHSGCEREDRLIPGIYMYIPAVLSFPSRAVSMYVCMSVLYYTCLSCCADLPTVMALLWEACKGP